MALRSALPRRNRLLDWVDRLHPANLAYATYEHRLLAGIAPEQRPHHVAVVGDGNRRWARMNAPGASLLTGYRAGADKIRDLVAWCDEAEIGVVTLWVLSTDNFRRNDADELQPLLAVIEEMVDDLARRWCVRIVGALDLLPPAMAERLLAAQAASAEHEGLCVNVAVGYGGRHELRDAFRSLLAERAAAGQSIADVAATLEMEHIESHLYTAGQPDPDLIIRTSGEQRLSGFLIWQAAHSEFYFHEALWPDFRKVDFVRALRAYAQRERRFGR